MRLEIGFIALLIVSTAQAATLDKQFGTGGVVITPTAPGAGLDLQAGLAVQRGKIVVGGVSLMGGPEGLQWRIVRYTKKGALDPTFGSGGTVLTNMNELGGFDEEMFSVAIQSDGKIVTAGRILKSGGQEDTALARYNPDGTLDETFGDGGKVLTDVDTGHEFRQQVLIDDDGRILVGGGCRQFFLVRYLPDGTLDPSFNPDGPRPGINITEVTPTGEGNGAAIESIAFDDRDRIVAGGYSFIAFDLKSTVARYDPDGTLDPSFNPNGSQPGIVVTDMAPDGGFDVVFRVALDREGRIVTVGDAFVGVGNGLFDIALARYLADGSLDDSFGDGGMVFTNAGPGDSDDDAQGLAIQPNGKILVGGSAAPTAFRVDSDFMVARYESDGSLDDSFGTGGILKTPTAPGNADDEIWSMALHNGAKLVAAGECDQPETGRDVCVVRYQLDGRDE